MAKAAPKEVLKFAEGLIEEAAKPRITPAALAALAASDMTNFFAASTPGGIEAQEAQGQRDLCVNGGLLPIDGGRRYQGEFEVIGIKFLGKADDLFYKVELPQGWRIAPTDHSMWSELLDAKCRKRAGIFYKAAFYDRSAHCNLERRYSYSYQPVDGWGNSSKLAAWVGVVTDGEQIIFKTAPTVIEPEFNREAREPWDAWIVERDARREEAKAWLVEHFPEWESPTAYWD